MCRSIKTLRGTEPTEEEVRAAALQFVRKVSGYRAPSKANEAVFTAAVDEIEAAAERLLAGLVAGPGQAGGKLRNPGTAPISQGKEPSSPGRSRR
ncbi:MAG TPA: DUF2277 domain-containing protein [Acidimicrobiia bacterium]|nr:DUF2277 domain-containing protein [Acidimicrobiia bacterium]